MCNLKCPLCALNYLDDIKKEHINIDKLIEFLNDFKDLKRILLVGESSEPTLYRHLFELIDYLHNRNIEIHICSNGCSHPNEWWIKLGKALNKNDVLEFCIDGSTQELHSKYRVGSNLNDVINNARSFRANTKCSDRVLTIRFEYNKDDIINIRDLVIKEGFDKHLVVDTKPVFKNKTPKISFDNDIKPIDELEIKFNALFKLGERVVDNKDNKTIICKSQTQKQVYVNNQLDIFPCSEMVMPCAPVDIVDNWDGDYNSILDFRHDVCFACEKGVLKYQELVIKDPNNFLV